MPTFNIKIGVQASGTDEAAKLAKALKIIINSTSKEDLIAVSELIENDPKLISKVKKFANSKIAKTFM